MLKTRNLSLTRLKRNPQDQAGKEKSPPLIKVMMTSKVPRGKKRLGQKRNHVESPQQL